MTIFFLNIWKLSTILAVVILLPITFMNEENKMTNFEHLMLCICFSVNLGFILGSAIFAATEIIEKIKKKFKK
jgi:hypothetical protein